MIKFFASCDEALSKLPDGAFIKIANAATRIGKPIIIVGSWAKGTAAYSNWDYIIPGMTKKDWKKIKNSIPGIKSGFDSVLRNIDVHEEPLRVNEPHIIIYPRVK